MAAEPSQVWDSIAELFPSHQDASQLEVFLQDEALESAGNLHFDDRSASSSWPSPTSERALQSSPSTPGAYLPQAWSAEEVGFARLSFSQSVPAECSMNCELSCPPRNMGPLNLPLWGTLPTHQPSPFGAARLEISPELEIGPELPVDNFERAVSCNLDQMGTLSGYPLASATFLQNSQDFQACGDGLRSFSLPVTGLDAACLSAAQQPAQTMVRTALGGMKHPVGGMEGGLTTPWPLGSAAEAEPFPEPQSWTEDPPLKRARSNASSISTYSASACLAAAAADSVLRPSVAARQGKRIVSGKGDFTFPVYKPMRRESFAPPLRCHIRTNALHFPDAISMFATETSSGDRQWLGRSGSSVTSRKSSDSQGTFFSCPKVTGEGLRSKRKRIVRSTNTDHSLDE